MSFLSRLTSLFALKQKTAVKLIAVMSVIAFVANLAPELYRDVPSLASGSSGDVTAAAPPTPPTNAYIVITKDGNADPTNWDGCTLKVGGTAIPEPVISRQQGHCNFAQAITAANEISSLLDGTALTVIVSERLVNTAETDFTSDYVIHLSSTPTIPALSSRRNNAHIVFDGVYGTNQKYVLQDASTGHNALDYFFKIGAHGTLFEQQILIRNFAFTGLKKVGAAAITTDNPSTTATGTYLGYPTVNPTRNVEGTQLKTLHIQNNYFGTTDGEALDAQNELFQGVRLFTTDITDASDILISDNNFYNTGLPIQLGTTVSSTIENCSAFVETGSVSIDHNQIGLDKNNSIGTTPSGSTLPEGGWNIYGINVCNLNNVSISYNTIANSVGLFMDTGIYASNSEVAIRNNGIGITTNADATDVLSPSINQAIYGTGILLFGNFTGSSGVEGSTITQNMVANIKLLNIPLFSQFIYCPTLFLDRYDFTRTNGKNCGGTAMRLEGSSNNTITQNTTVGLDKEVTPMAIYSNDGYGIELEGFSIPGDVVTGDINVLSSNNKITQNVIAYNKADGIMISSVDRYTTAPALDPVDRACTTATILSVGSGYSYTNNCGNTILQNAIFRNGAFNASSFGLSSNNEGGIGIDLKQVTNSEQKYGATMWTSSGTTNDSDLSLNDTGATNDIDNGGNGMLNYPLINGSGALSTSSTNYNIQGSLPDNINGSYWVEVFQILCPADVTAAIPITITDSNAHTNCDTDSRSLVEQGSGSTFGQGSQFLCGTLVQKTAGGSNWSCKPSDFNTTFNGGLITTTVTEAWSPKYRPAYSLMGLESAPRYTCGLAAMYYTSIDEWCPDGSENTSPLGLIDAQGVILSGLGNTSEFSANVFIPAPSLVVSKTARNCTDATAVNCSGDFAASVNRNAGQVTEFRIDILNNTASTSEINLVDTLPSNMHWVTGSCAYYKDLAAMALVRPTSGPLACAPSGSNLNVSLPASSGLLTATHLTLFILAQVNDGVINTTITNSATVTTAGEVCNVSSTTRCDARATVVVSRTPNATVTKEIVSPNSSDTSTATETLTAPTVSTPVQYRVTLNIEGVTRSAITASVLNDTFPHAIGSSTIAYTNCKYLVKVNGVTVVTATDCVTNEPTINTTTTAVAVWNGSTLPASVTTNDQVQVVVTYTGTVPANPLLAGAAPAVMHNVTTWTGTQGTLASRTAATDLTITSPTLQNPQVVPPSIHKQVRACTGATADTCTGAFNEIGITSVVPGSTVEFRFEATASSGATFSLRDAAPTGVSFLTTTNSCQSYTSTTQLAGTAARPSTGGTACTIDGSSVLTTNNLTIAANGYAYTYALATVASTATGTITNTATIVGNGCNGSLAQCSDTATVAVTAPTLGQVTIAKSVLPETLTSSTTATQDVTYTIVINKPNTFGITNAVLSDTFPTTPVALSNYTCTSIVVEPTDAQTLACPTTFPPAGGSIFSSGTTINAAVTRITLTYTARVPVNAVTTTAQTVTNTATLDGNRSTDNVAIHQTDTATLTVSPNAGTSGGNTTTSVVSLTKRANNNVTGTDRTLETIYKPGDTVNYTLSLLNTGTAAATGVTLQDLFHSMVRSMTINALPSGATQSLTTTTFNFGNITVPTGTTPTTVTYHGTIADKDTFDLDLFDLNSSSNPTRDDDFYAPKDADFPDESIGTSGNSHRRAEDILGAPDGRFTSLGSDGSLVINLGSKVIVNGTGTDFALKTINQSPDDTDQTTEDLKVSVSQDGTTFKTISPSSDTFRYDLNKAHMSWARYIKLEDQSSSVKAKAPGTDIDAICLLNIGVQLPNRVNMTVGTQTAFAVENVTVDVTKVFSKKPSVDNCLEPDPTPTVVAQLPLPPPPAVLPPAPVVYIPTTPPALPKTGATPLVLVSLVSSLAWVFTRKKK